MITLTKDAEQAIRHLVVVEEARKVVGMRVSTNLEGDTVDLELVREPGQNDQKLEGVQVPVFIEPGLAAELDGYALHADIDEAGEVAFSLVDLEEGSPSLGDPLSIR